MKHPSVLKVAAMVRRILNRSFTHIAYRYEHLTTEEKQAVGTEADWKVLMDWLGGPNRAKYGWMILVDRTQMSGEACVRGLVGPSNIDPLISEQLFTTDDCVKWRARDDDGELYYEGLIYGVYTGFEPLDDYARPNAGCTSIEYWNNEAREWRVL